MMIQYMENLIQTPGDRTLITESQLIKQNYIESGLIVIGKPTLDEALDASELEVQRMLNDGINFSGIRLKLPKEKSKKDTK